MKYESIIPLKDIAALYIEIINKIMPDKTVSVKLEIIPPNNTPMDDSVIRIAK